MVEELLTLADVAEHNTNKSVWFVIHNNVYDVTEFLNEHPGGEEVLIEQAGKDATEAFEDVGHSSDARERMTKYRIGQIIASERRIVPEKSEPVWKTDGKQEDVSMKSWVLPLLIGLLATLLYKYCFAK